MRTLRPLGLLMALGVAGAVPSRAQVIAGHVLEAETDRPVPFAEVSVLDEEGEIVGTAFADGGGRFSVRLPRSGTFTVYATRLGYFNAVSEGIEVAPRQQVAIAVRLAPAPLTVDSLEVEVEGRSLQLVRAGFYDRRTREDIAALVLDGMAIHPPWEDILEVQDIEGVEVYPRPSQIPARFENLTADRSRGGASAQCGIVVAWSRRGPRED